MNLISRSPLHIFLFLLERGFIQEKRSATRECYSHKVDLFAKSWGNDSTALNVRCHYCNWISGETCPVLWRGPDGRRLCGAGLKRLSPLHLSLHTSPTHRSVSEKCKWLKEKRAEHISKGWKNPPTSSSDHLLLDALHSHTFSFGIFQPGLLGGKKVFRRFAKVLWLWERPLQNFF